MTIRLILAALVLAASATLHGCGGGGSGDGDADFESDAGGDTGGDADSDADDDTDGDVDVDGDTEVDADSDADVEGDADADADGDRDQEADGDTEADTDVTGDSDADPDVTACGPDGLLCDQETEICVANVAWTTEYRCAPVPAGCEDHRTCDCAGATLCDDIYDWCRDGDPMDNELSCECTAC